MSDWIVETIGSWGVRTSKAMSRLKIPQPGDPVWVQSDVPEYRIRAGETYRVDRLRDDGRIVLVDTTGDYCSMHLMESGRVDTSGGPFVAVRAECLVPNLTVAPVVFWNWGDHSPGGGQGVHYTLLRPVFLLVSPPVEVAL